MYKNYKYLFYKLYKLFLRINGETGIPEYTAMLVVAQNFFANLLALYIFICKLFTGTVLLRFINNWTIFIYLSVFLVPFYLSLVFRSKYKKIVNEFRNESKEQRISGKRSVILYLAISFLFQILSVLYLLL